MPKFVIHHRHAPEDCGVAFTAFRGHDSELRHRPTLASCAAGDHAIWWTVEAASAADALSLLPFFVAQRSTAVGVDEVQIP